MTANTPPALTTLTEDELLFRDSVRAFADAEIGPQVHEMDDRQTIPRTLLDDLFALGVMGVEIPNEFGGGKESLFPVT